MPPEFIVESCDWSRADHALRGQSIDAEQEGIPREVVTSSCKMYVPDG